MKKSFSQNDVKQIDLSTIDSFQGREKEIIIMTATRNNPKKDIGFLSDEKRLNVSVTRAKRLFVMIGNSACFARTHMNLRFISKVFETSNTYGDVLRFESFQRTLKRVNNRQLYSYKQLGEAPIKTIPPTNSGLLIDTVKVPDYFGDLPIEQPTRLAQIEDSASVMALLQNNTRAAASTANNTNIALEAMVNQRASQDRQSRVQRQQELEDAEIIQEQDGYTYEDIAD